MAESAPAAPASMVFTATTAMRRSPPARVEPGVKPNQPNARDGRAAAGGGRAGVKADPAEREDERAEDRHRDVMAGNRNGLAVLRVLADARADDDGAGERRHPADHVHDGRSGEVDMTVAEPEVDPELREPSAAPHPVRI